MRLFVVLVSALLSLVPSVAIAREEPGGGAMVYQVAEADWLDLKAKTFYFALGLRGVGAPQGVVNQGFVGKGKCDVHRTKHFTSISCSGRGYGGDTGVDGFQMDPALGSAHLELSVRGFDHVVDWTGSEIPMAGVSAFAGGGAGADATAGVARWAPAAGELFGKKVRAGGPFGFGFLAQGAAAYLYADGRAVWFGRDGLPRVRATYRIPR